MDHAIILIPTLQVFVYIVPQSYPDVNILRRYLTNMFMDSESMRLLGLSAAKVRYQKMNDLLEN